ncbi:MAG: helix-turn-helix domain-containing protein [Archaeoglobaceae archaeon]|nr:helix-turn-helix domain-containing protein [Archaeoglobaceae archaeon]MDW8118430.1 helix-turn-helix domain-containing protein [Archaeoglobaceae archaeon]
MSNWEEYSGSIEKSKEYHERYHRAVNHPIRKEILKLILKGLSEDEIAKILKLSRSEFDYHLQVLIQGFCVKRVDGKLVVTQEGMVVEFL